MPTLVVSDAELAARKAAQPGRNRRRRVRARTWTSRLRKRRSPLVLVGALAIVFLILVGAGGYAFMKFKGTNTGATTPSGGSDLPVPMHEVARYWIEVDTKNRDAAIRAGDTVPMQSGESFKFHFSPNENGFLYIVGPGAQQRTDNFLDVLQPTPGSRPRSEFSRERPGFRLSRRTLRTEATGSLWISNAGTDEFTFVFSPAPLTSPAFFAAPAPHAY